MEVGNLARDNGDLAERLEAELIRFHGSLPPGPHDPRTGDDTYDGPRAGDG